MPSLRQLAVVFLVLALPFTVAPAEENDPGICEEARNVFKNAGESGQYLDSCYGYALFPTIGKGGLMYEASIGGQKFSYRPK